MIARGLQSPVGFERLIELINERIRVRGLVARNLPEHGTGELLTDDPLRLCGGDSRAIV